MLSANSLHIGISLFIRKGGQSMWENGIFQNCLFLAMLLQQSPIVADVVLVIGGGEASTQEINTFLQDSPVAYIDMETAISQLDVMIEMSAQLDQNWVIHFKAKGGKVISMRVGNDYVIDIERMIFDKPAALLITTTPYDEIWTLPEYEKTGMPYYASALHTSVKLMPHLWSPIILNNALNKQESNNNFGYQSGRRRRRIGMFEPNVCMVKTSYIPLLISEYAHRQNPDIIEHVYAYNTYKLKNHSAFNAFANSLDIVQQGITSFEGRYPIWQILSQFCDVVVSHQWENAQNYVYYEALYGGYPLVHNSHLLADCGYYYHHFDCEEGGQQLLQALIYHDQNLISYRQKAAEFLKTVDPLAENNVRCYTDALLNLYQ